MKVQQKFSLNQSFLITNLILARKVSDNKDWMQGKVYIVKDIYIIHNNGQFLSGFKFNWKFSIKTGFGGILWMCQFNLKLPHKSEYFHQKTGSVKQEVDIVSKEHLLKSGLVTV